VLFGLLLVSRNIDPSSFNPPPFFPNLFGDSALVTIQFAVVAFSWPHFFFGRSLGALEKFVPLPWAVS